MQCQCGLFQSRSLRLLGLLVGTSLGQTIRTRQPELIQAAPAHGVPPNETVTFSLADLEAIAIQRNPTLAQAAAQIAGSRGAALEAGLYPNPVIGYEGEQMGAAGTAGELQGGFIQQTIVTAGKLRLSRAKYNQEAFEAGILAMGQQLTVLNGVRTRFYELLAVQRMIELRRELLTNSQENLRTTREMFNTGLANEAEVLLAEIEINRAQIALADEENQFGALWRNLAAVIGWPDLPPTPLAGRLEPDSSSLEWDNSLALLLHESPEIQAARAM